MSSTLKYCWNADLLKGLSGETPTHLLLDSAGGGKIYADRLSTLVTRFGYPNAQALLYEAIALDLCRGTPLYVVECTGRYFRMFLDVDVETETEIPITSETVVEYVRLMQAVVRRFYPSLAPREQTVVVCRAPLKRLGKGGFKQGLHVYFSIVVSMEVAGWMREAVLGAFVDAYGANEPYQNAWDDIIDAAPFRALMGSLRMQGSDKYNKETKQGEERVYTPFLVVDANGAPNAEALASIAAVPGGQLGPGGENLVKMRRLLVNTTIRTNRPPTRNFRPFDGAPDPADAEARRSSGGGGGWRGASEPVDEDSVEEEAIRRIITDGFGSTYEDTCLAGSHALSNEKDVRTTFLVKVKPGTHNAKYCHHKGECHSSATVYFIIKRDVIQQRCYCTKPEPRGPEWTTCKEWSGAGGKSAPYTVSTEDLETLFES